MDYWLNKPGIHGFLAGIKNRAIFLLTAQLAIVFLLMILWDADGKAPFIYMPLFVLANTMIGIALLTASLSKRLEHLRTRATNYFLTAVLTALLFGVYLFLAPIYYALK